VLKKHAFLHQIETIMTISSKYKNTIKTSDKSDFKNKVIEVLNLLGKPYEKVIFKKDTYGNNGELTAFVYFGIKSLTNAICEISIDEGAYDWDDVKIDLSQASDVMVYRLKEHYGDDWRKYVKMKNSVKSDIISKNKIPAMKKQIVDASICVKITAFGKSGHAEEVVYYRNAITETMAVKWRPYFEHLVKLVEKANFPHKVELTVVKQDLLQGKEYIEAKSKCLLSSKKGQLKRLNAEIEIEKDLFGFDADKSREKITRIEGEIASLERGEFNYYVPATYINKIKEFTSKKHKVENAMNATKPKEFRRYILNVKLTPEQQKLYADGEFIWVENMKKTDGTFFSSFAYEDEMKGLSFSSVNLKELAKELDGKPQLKTIAYGGVSFTPEQVLKFNSGKTIYLEGAVKDGETEGKNIFITKIGNKERDIEVVVKKSMQNMPSLDQIKQISIADYLAERGIEPVNIKGDELWYYSPIREESKPSFRVSKSRNTFMDFGKMDKPDSIIGLVMQMYGTSFADSVKILSERSDLSITERVDRKSPVDYEKKITVTQVKSLQDRGLFAYLYERGIDPEIAKKYCKQVHYKIDGNDKEYYAVGFQNDKGDWELRNKYFKGCTGKNITCIDKSLAGTSFYIGKKPETCNVFEGFMDFLSYETLNKQNPTQYPDCDAVILNGVTNIEKNSVEIEKFICNDFVSCYTDNDPVSKTGEQAFLKLKRLILNPSRNYPKFIAVGDMSYLYKDPKKHMDFNKFLIRENERKKFVSINQPVKKNVGVKF
jgi:hypothetical protein